MGTASTMALIAETLGMTLPGIASIPADRLRASEEAGALAASMAVAGTPTPDWLITRQSVDNALRVLLAVSGSTNAIIHLTAIAGRLGIDIDLAHFNALSDETPHRSGLLHTTNTRTASPWFVWPAVEDALLPDGLLLARYPLVADGTRRTANPRDDFGRGQRPIFGFEYRFAFSISASVSESLSTMTNGPPQT